MPEIGEIRKGADVGYKRHGKYIWAACLDCGRERWVYYIKKEKRAGSLRCRRCNQKGEGNSGWKGGRRETPRGYILIWVSPDDFFYPMADKKGYILEHRLVVAKALNRCLLPWELVHHKGKKYLQGSIKNKSDNRYPENLELLPAQKYHLVDALTQARITNLEKRVTLLEAENILLKSQLSLLNRTYPKD